MGPELPLLLANVSGAEFSNPDVACAARLDRIADQPQERGEAGKREGSESERPRVVLDVADGTLREKRRVRKRPGPKTESEWESEPAE